MQVSEKEEGSGFPIGRTVALQGSGWNITILLPCCPFGEEENTGIALLNCEDLDPAIVAAGRGELPAMFAEYGQAAAMIPDLRECGAIPGPYNAACMAKLTAGWQELTGYVIASLLPGKCPVGRGE